MKEINEGPITAPSCENCIDGALATAETYICNPGIHYIDFPKTLHTCTMHQQQQKHEGSVPQKVLPCTAPSCEHCIDGEAL